MEMRCREDNEKISVQRETIASRASKYAEHSSHGDTKQFYFRAIYNRRRAGSENFERYYL